MVLKRTENKYIININKTISELYFPHSWRSKTSFNGRKQTQPNPVMELFCTLILRDPFRLLKIFCTMASGRSHAGDDICCDSRLKKIYRIHYRFFPIWNPGCCAIGGPARRSRSHACWLLIVDCWLLTFEICRPLKLQFTFGQKFHRRVVVFYRR